MRISRVSGLAFSSLQKARPSIPGMPTSSTITSGAERAISSRGLGGAAGLVHVDVDGLEGRPKQSAEPSIVVYQQQSHRHPLIRAFDSRYRLPGPHA